MDDQEIVDLVHKGDQVECARLLCMHAHLTWQLACDEAFDVRVIIFKIFQGIDVTEEHGGGEVAQLEALKLLVCLCT